MNKIRTADLFKSNNPLLRDFLAKYEYPWEALPHIKDLISECLEKGLEGFTKLKENVLVGKDVKIAETVTIIGPAIIGHNSVLRPGAYLRENCVIGENCTVGNSTEVKNAIMLDHAQAPHFNYVGDSILGEYAHLGAGAICSNLKADNTQVVIHADKDYPTGLRKVGVFLGEHVEVGCQCVLNPGTIIGAHTNVYPLTSVRGVHEDNLIIKSKDLIIEKK